MDNENKVPGFGNRHVQIFFMFVLFAIGGGMRAQLSVALVAMTQRSTSNPDVPVFDWDNKSVILSSFIWGYIWLQIFASNLGRVYGTKYFLLVSMAISATLNCLIPIVTIKWGSTGLIVFRVLQGLVQGIFYPSINDVLSKWSPKSELARLGNFAFSGATFSTIFTLPLVAVISTTWYGWPLSFYLFGGLGYLWIIAFYFVGASSPASHPSISKAEKEYIESGLNTEGHKEKIPWKKIFCNVPFWALFIVQIGHFYCAMVLQLETPNYLSQVMEFDITSSGLISAAPHIASFLVLIVYGYGADYIINNNMVSLTWTRKLFTAIGCILPAITLLILGFLPKDAKIMSVIMLILASAGHVACGSGSNINHIDLSPKFAGVLLGMINSSGTLVSILGPLSVQFIVQDDTNIEEWRIVFIITAVMYILPCIFYLIFGSAEVQPFDSSKGNSSEDKKKHSVISVIST